MEKYLIKFAYERDTDYFMWEVKRRTEHWFFQPKIRRYDRTIEFGNAIIVLASDHKHMVGRHDHTEILAYRVLDIIDKMNRDMVINHQGIFNK